MVGLVITDHADYEHNRETNVRRINQYTIGGKIGRGTFNRVRLLTAGTTNYACKVYSKNAANRKRMPVYTKDRDVNMLSQLELLEREIGMLEQLDHPHVVRLREVIDAADNDHLYFIFDYAAGGPIMTYSKSANCYTVGKSSTVTATTTNIAVYTEGAAAYVTRQIGSALAYLHEKRIVHKDIKCCNVVVSHSVLDLAEASLLVRHRRRPLLCNSDSSSDSDEDTGPPLKKALSEFEAMRLDVQSAEEIQQVQDILAKHCFKATLIDFNSAVECENDACEIYDCQGTQSFTPPEAFLPHEGYAGIPRDHWSLGCFLYCLLFGSFPYEGAFPLALQAAICSSNAVEFPFEEVGVSEVTQEVLRGLLAKPVEERWTTAKFPPLYQPSLC